MQSRRYIFPLILFGFTLAAIIGWANWGRVSELPPAQTASQTAESTSTSTNPTESLFFDFYDDTPLGCPGYQRITNALGEALVLQTAAPRRRQSVSEEYDLSLRNKWGRDDERYVFTVKMEQPDKSVAIATGTIVRSEPGFVNIPRDFTTFKPLVGVYRLFFQVNDRMVACDAFRITE